MNKLVAAAVAFVAFGAIAYAVSATDPWQKDGAGGAEDIDAIVTDLFTDHVIAFEVLGILLTAAMIGALVIARPLTGGLDSAHYPKGKDMAKTQAVSDVAATYAAPARMSELLGAPQTLDDVASTQEEE